MSLLLGVDTGGTYTDAVLIRDETVVLAKAKALTTRQDLAIGVGEAVARVLDLAGVAAADVAMASLSTTLATNALVEGHGARVGLIYAGFRHEDLDKHGLAEALGQDPVCILAGGHGHAGEEAQTLDEAGLRTFLDQHAASVSAFAVAARFATRNPAHELRMADIVAEYGRPVSSSHQLSAKLGGPKRALTALLNARLIGMIDALIGQAATRLEELGIQAPLMVVRGDGALMSAAEARRRPIETILSGPAASLVGARWLTQADTAMVSDIGGTTTDVALLRDGRPALDAQGAQVGPFRTMVEAVKMRTFGLGGDSEVHLQASGLQGGVRLGPRRVLPVSLVAQEAPDVVLPVLDMQLRQTSPGEYDARFLKRVAGRTQPGMAAREADLLARMGDGVQPLGSVLRTRRDGASLRRLVDQGLVQVAGVTPSDAAHVLGLATQWHTEAARMALTLFGRRRDGAGQRLAADAKTLARMIVDQMTLQTGQVLLETAFEEEQLGLPGSSLADHVLTQRGLAGHSNIMRLDVGLALPIVALGASAGTYYPAVGRRLRAETQVPDHADVANAIGAIVGRIAVRREGSVTSRSDGRFRAYLGHGPVDFPTAEAAMDALEAELVSEARGAAMASGATEIEVTPRRQVKEAEIENRRVVVQADIRVEASGRPAVVTRAAE